MHYLRRSHFGSEEHLLETGMFGKLGLPELLIILAIALLIFGPRKLGELGKGLGEGIRGFKDSMKDSEKPSDPEKK
jgi:sec-independent protein translocase protein TatA